MVDNCICIIPARGGSKRIKRKNIKEFSGKPMIYWSIDAAKKANIFDRIVVSTDCKDIADIALQGGAEIPFIRDKELADDYVGTKEVIQDAIKRIEIGGNVYQTICCLYATAPFTESEDLEQAVMRSRENKGYMIYPVTTFDYPIQRAIKIERNGCGTPIKDKYNEVRSQDLEQRYHDVGQFYCADRRRWQEQTPMNMKTKPIIIPRWRTQDIDTPDDWYRAELMKQVIDQWKRIGSI